MTPTVPLPPPPVPFETCAQAYDWWGQGRIRWDSLINGEIWLANGLRCPISESPHRVPVEVLVPPGQPYIRPGLAETAAATSWAPWALGLGITMILAGILFVAFTRPRRKEASVRHHWQDQDPGGGIAESSVAAVTGLGEPLEPGEDAVAAAERIPPDWPDHRGERDRDPDAPHPWRPHD